MRFWLKLVTLLFWAAWKILSWCVRMLWRLWKRRPKNLDNAAFASPRELKRGGYFKPNGFLVGLSGTKRVYLDPESSVMIFGSRGAGKTQTIIANLKAMKVGPDLIIADPVGDIEHNTDMAAKGYGIIRLDLTDPRSSDKYDPLTFLDRGLSFDYPRDVMTFCGTLIASTGTENDAGLHFLESARAMLQSMVMWRGRYPENGYTLADIVIRLLVDKKARTREFDKMRGSSHVLVRQGVEAFEGAGDREKGSMDSTLARKLRALLDDSVRYITTVDANEERWSFEDVFNNRKPMAIFIRSGLGNEEFGGALVRVVLSNAINTARRMWNQTGKPLPKGLWMFVDEARSMGDSPAIVHAVNELRKARVNVCLTYHTLADVKECFKSPHALLNGCAWLIHGGSRDLQLFKEASSLAGDMTAVSKTISKSGESKHESARPLVKAGELQSLPGDEVVVIGHGITAKLKKPWAIRSGVVHFP